jgi:2-polyprenyl-6-methoxyphenol hydroxylase-like FAD-dependent oxidoreductase
LAPTSQVDVMVLGGGPAGCAAALGLTQQGHSVVVVERSEYQAVRIGETLPPIARNLLAELGVWDHFLRGGHSPSFGVSSAWGRATLYENDFIYNPYGHGWHVDRARFDAMLAQTATEAGAKVCRGTRLNRLEQNPSGDWEFDVVTASGPCRYRSRFCVDASGRAATFARKQGAHRVLFDRLFAVVAFLASTAAGTPLDCRTLVEAAEQGWWYSARLPNSQLVIAYMTDADLYARRQGDRAAELHEQLRHAPHTQALTQHCSIANGPRIFAANSSRLDRPAGRNWLAVGDAAMSFDPLSSQGVCRALESGLAAARSIQAVWDGDETALDRYVQSIDRIFTNYLRERNFHYSREKRWLHSTFWRRRMNSISDTDPSPISDC